MRSRNIQINSIAMGVSGGCHVRTILNHMTVETVENLGGETEVKYFDRLRCNYCGKFIKNGYTYTPFGTYLDEEPPEDEYICYKCFTPERKITLNAMWRKPMKWGD